MSIVCFIFCHTERDISFVNDPCRVCGLLCISWCISPQPLSIIVCFIFCCTERDRVYLHQFSVLGLCPVVQIVPSPEPLTVVCRTERNIPLLYRSWRISWTNDLLSVVQSVIFHCCTDRDISAEPVMCCLSYRAWYSTWSATPHTGGSRSAWLSTSSPPQCTSWPTTSSTSSLSTACPWSSSPPPTASSSAKSPRKPGRARVSSRGHWNNYTCGYTISWVG